jgi:signal transduction histidine kinase
MSFELRRLRPPAFLVRPAEKRKVSVYRRLSMLVLTAVSTAALVLGMAIIALARLASERDYMDRYVFAPLMDIGQAQAARDELFALVEQPPYVLGPEAHAPLLRLDSFVDRYRREWETGPSERPEAARLRAELERQGQSSLLEREHELTVDIAESVKRLERAASSLEVAHEDPPIRRTSLRAELASLDASLTGLELLNQRYVQIGYRAFERMHKRITVAFVLVSLVGIAAATWIGLFVRHAIAPRVATMVQAIDRFRDTGAFDPVGDEGDDDLARLDHALRLSFRAMTERDEERERFLAVAAHELKTPLTTMKGFAQVAIAHADDASVRGRALAAIDRQSTRLGRLLQDLLWSVRAHAGRLPFHPGPVDMEALTRHALAEVHMVCNDRMFDFTLRGDPHVLGDPGLLEQAVFNLGLFACNLSSDGDTRVGVVLDDDGGRTRLSLEAHTRPELSTDVEHLVEPFGEQPYEGRSSGTRSTGLGLYLVRQIARLHGALFHVEPRPGTKVGLVFELRH